MFTALGMTLLGSAASPAVMPSVSIPPKANITTANEANSPSKPWGNNPPCSTRLPSPGATVEPPAWKPKAMMAAPPAIMAMMATTLINENQNSSSPKTLTLSRFSAARKQMIARIQIQRSTWGNQKPM